MLVLATTVTIGDGKYPGKDSIYCHRHCRKYQNILNAGNYLSVDTGWLSWFRMDIYDMFKGSADIPSVTHRTVNTESKDVVRSHLDLQEQF